MYDLYIFDLDGTLIDSYKTIGGLFNNTLKKYNLPEINLEEYRYLLGNGAKNLVNKGIKRSLELKGENLTKDEFDELENKIYSYYIDYYENYDDNITESFSGIKSTLNILKAWNKKIAICTNKPQKATDNIVNKIFGENYFDMVVGVTDYSIRKPSPIMLEDIIKKLNTNKDRVAYFGDTSVDMETGRNAGVLTVGVTWGFRDKEELMNTGAQRIIDREMDILRV